MQHSQLTKRLKALELDKMFRTGLTAVLEFQRLTWHCFQLSFPNVHCILGNADA